MRLAEQLKSKTNKQLSQMLRDNLQKVSGKKDELCQRVADCMLFGCIPECPECGAKGLKVKYLSANHGGQGHWSHRGFFDDGEFTVCGFSSKEDVERYKWTDMNW